MRDNNAPNNGGADRMAVGGGEGPTTGTRSARVRPAARARTYGAIDLGTNNCRMLIARPDDAGFRVIDAFSRIVRLGEGLGGSGMLSEAAMARTISALHICARKMRHKGVARARSIATEACRLAENCDEFLDRVAAETGITFEVISRREEAGLALAGCVPLLDDNARRALVFDIGGGSTELVWLRCDGATPNEIIGWTSLPCGVVSLSERYGGDRVTAADYAAMVDDAGRLLAPFNTAHGVADEVAAGDTQLIGTSGTVTTIAGVLLDLPKYNRALIDGIRLDFDDIRRITADLLDLDLAARAVIPSIGPERADLVIAGCAILEAIERAWPIGHLTVADRGLREGMLVELMREDGHRDSRGKGAHIADHDAIGSHPLPGAD